ncbi:mycofactocin precursor [Thermomonospora echinospora]|uniref:Mycofactocin n=1 Tax=Thermomonospora echinospora TaxID=1992 RepID=A0A1H6C3J6_9ACTN|nr:mycofactocin precursor MftA [Thermomonospora echinospora]SEG67215.1 mycofactocin precursor [Thermomonospora echinospora]
MSGLSQVPASVSPSPAQDERATAPDGQDLLEQDLLVEEVSIDGMCGVY